MTTQAKKLNDSACNIVSAWILQEEALKEAPLAYLDTLLDVLLDSEFHNPDLAAYRLHKIVPDLPYGTAESLAFLKRRNFHEAAPVPKNAEWGPEY